MYFVPTITDKELSLTIMTLVKAGIFPVYVTTLTSHGQANTVIELSSHSHNKTNFPVPPMLLRLQIFHEPTGEPPRLNVVKQLIIQKGYTLFCSFIRKLKRW